MLLRYIMNPIHGGSAEENNCTSLLLGMDAGISRSTEKGRIRCSVCMNEITLFLDSKYL